MIYLFSSANSFNSILTIDKESKGEGYSDSIFEISKELGLEKVFLVEKNPSSFPQALKNASSMDLQLVYGLEFIVCEDSEDKTLESITTEHKVIIFAKNGLGYKNGLMQLYSDSATRGKYGSINRTDFKNINKFWSENLVMMIPFYDNFIAKNLLTFGNCMVNLEKYNPVFCIEYHELPLDKLMSIKIKNYCKENGYETISTHTARYKAKEDIKAYMNYRVIQNKTDMQCPNLNGFCSDKFNVT